ncbi:diaminopimelate epimerase [Nocardioides jishulii]|uniref:Diaminopimelate epimerase n=1 Tax=Nocardioides jishulii TaxID=2575440 RepID=A0A4U2YST5_9ACTN|nr:diaminopimelate epimerase [Nocardioides jishulii]QCX28511.1 diaminopimelate epimerase [Nocardioides jishulii]TKI64596.1 diaminopimelate epimerase [Nocardioides jishulii]
MSYPFLKGHGTENDFVLLPDHDGSLHGELPVERVRALCDRRAGIGGDGVLRVVRTEALGESGPEWFMDYRNSDGSVSEMCGNGVRVFARHLLDEGLVAADRPVEVATRGGVKVVTVSGDLLTVDMGKPLVGDPSTVSVGERAWTAANVDMGNPHAVAFVDDLSEAGSLLVAPGHDAGVYPHGVNVEFVVRRGEHHVAMRVHERGSGETRSCGTGACAVMVATALLDDAARGTAYAVDVPGGTLSITWTEDDRILMTGPAVLVARGETDL